MGFDSNRKLHTPEPGDVGLSEYPFPVGSFVNWKVSPYAYPIDTCPWPHTLTESP